MLNIVRGSVPYFLILFAASFSLIFLLRLVIQD